MFLDHVVHMENPSAHGLDVEPRRFRLSVYRDGTGEDANIRDAIYENPQPTVKKTAKAPGVDDAASYDYGPDADVSDVEEAARQALKSRSGRGRSDKRAALTRLAKATAEYTRELGKAKKAVRKATGEGKSRGKGGSKGKKNKGRKVDEEEEAEWSQSDASQSDEDAWKELQGDGSSSDEGDGLEDADLDEDLAAVESTIGGAISDDDDDNDLGVPNPAEAFERAPPSRATRASTSKASVAPEPATPPPTASSSRTAGRRAQGAKTRAEKRDKGKGRAVSSQRAQPAYPAAVASDGAARYLFLRSLCPDQPYADMLERIHPLVRSLRAH